MENQQEVQTQLVPIKNQNLIEQSLERRIRSILVYRKAINKPYFKRFSRDKENTIIKEAVTRSYKWLKSHFIKRGLTLTLTSVHEVLKTQSYEEELLERLRHLEYINSYSFKSNFPES